MESEHPRFIKVDDPQERYNEETKKTGQKSFLVWGAVSFLFFLLVHGVVSFVSVVDSFKGQFGIVMADDILFSSGDGWYQLCYDFLSLPIVNLIVQVIAIAAIMYIAYNAWASIRQIRGKDIDLYVCNTAKGEIPSAKITTILCIFILGLLFIHLSHFWAKMTFMSFRGLEAENPYLLLLATFRNPVIVIGYFIWFGALFFLIKRTIIVIIYAFACGDVKENEKKYKTYSLIVSSLILFLFVSTVINAFIEANYRFGAYFM